MICRIAFVIPLMTMIGLTMAQEPEKCRIEKTEAIGFKYRVGRTERSNGSVPSVIVQISVAPRNINSTDLETLAKHLNRVFCKEPRLNVVIFDSYLYAENFLPGDQSSYYYRGLESMRGAYYLDRESGEEFVEFTTGPNYFKNKQNRVRVNIGKISEDMTCH